MKVPKSVYYDIVEETSESDFSDNRLLGIGGSDAAAIIGKSPWKTNRDLYFEKTGKGVEFKSNPAIQFGNDMEPLLHDMFYFQYPEFKQYETKGMSFVSVKYPWMRANLDGFYKYNGEYGVLEIKTVMRNTYWTQDEIPEHYFCQLLHYMAVMNVRHVTMYAFFNTSYSKREVGKLMKYEFSWDEVKDSIDYLIHKEKEFWDQVKQRKPPRLMIEI